MANVTCEYDSGSNNGTAPSGQPPSNGSNANGRRVRRSETLLSQAADFVSRGETFQTVSDMFNIPISTIRFYMARKGILPRRKRGRTAILPYVVTGTSQIPLAVPSSSSSAPSSASASNNNQLQATSFNVQQRSRSRSSSPAELLCFANYKLPELRPKLV